MSVDSSMNELEDEQYALDLLVIAASRNSLVSALRNESLGSTNLSSKP